jgi:hypothetical protein
MLFDFIQIFFCQAHIWTNLLFIYLYQVLHIENNLLFCSKLCLLMEKL